MTPHHGSKRAQPARHPAKLALLRAAVGFTERLAPSLTDRLLWRLFLTPPRHPRTAKELEALGRAEAFPIPFAEGHLAAWSLGSGPAVLLLHGWGGRGGQWLALAQHLAARGFRVVFADAPGHGDTPGKRSSLPAFAEASLAAGRTLGPLHAVVGHSLGGAATAFALSRGLRTERTILMAAPAHPHRYFRLMMARLGIPESAWASHEEAFEKHLGLPWSAADVPGHLAAHPRPTLIVQDADDPEVPFSDAEDLAAAGPHVRLLRTEGLGHRRLLKHPSVMDEVASFIQLS